MDYTYYSPPPHQQYQPFQIPHPQEAEIAQHGQFQHRPSDHHYDPRFQPFDTQLYVDSSALIEVHSSPSPGNYANSDCGDIHSNGITRITLEDFRPDKKTFPRGKSEEKDTLTLAQSRRKEQNRAAQRAFRERKERRVRDLEEELNQYKSNYSSLMEDHKSLKRQIEKVVTENEILRATSNNNNAPESMADYGPNRVRTPTELLRNLTDYSARSGDTKEFVRRPCGNRKEGNKLLDASATWDLIVRHLSNRGMKLDVQDIYDRLKGHALRDGQGLVPEVHVIQAIKESATRGAMSCFKSDLQSIYPRHNIFCYQQYPRQTSLDSAQSKYWTSLHSSYAPLTS
ncbi:hypothetical protein ACJ72_01778 [Emergomyces africanus]|uniref:BZIP domain-containing protein n=1 Tax=Emergomyces africanus TaxID=1955775 RepID=A0A1B7P4E0_9EURO|nr:hypothetical protein ACJ72_01778 [Emergomyces africanus]